jgi:hypothetical protein
MPSWHHAELRVWHQRTSVDAKAMINFNYYNGIVTCKLCLFVLLLMSCSILSVTLVLAFWSLFSQVAKTRQSNMIMIGPPPAGPGQI